MKTLPDQRRRSGDRPAQPKVYQSTSHRERLLWPLRWNDAMARF
jgi:hypothetical protein